MSVDTTAPSSFPRRLGMWIQALALGVLLTWAEFNALAALTHSVIFRYQGY